MVLISALSVGGVVLISGQKQYDEQNFGLLSIQSKRIESEIMRYFDEIDQLSSIILELPIHEVSKDYAQSIARHYKDLKFIQIFSENGSLIETINFSSYQGEVDSLYPSNLERPLVLGPGRSIFTPKLITFDSVPSSDNFAVVRVKIDRGNKYLVLGIDLVDHFKRFSSLQGDGAELILFNAEGSIIYHPNPLKRLSIATRHPYSINDEFKDADLKTFTNVRRAQTLKMLTEYRKETSYLFFRSIEYKKNFLVGMVYVVPTINLPSFIRSFEAKQLFFVVVLISFLPLLGWPMLKYLFRDLEEITKKAQLYTNGEHDIVIDVHSQDEIGVLALTFQGMIRQVNERTRFLRKSERRIREARDQAEQALSSKSHLLEDLREQKTEIERVSKDKDDLLAIVSHDLKNPLAVIETSMDVIMEEEKDNPNEVTRDLLRRSKNSARIALNLITDLLDLARLEGGIKLDFEKFSVDDLLENVVDSYYLKAKEKNIEVKIEHEESFELIADYGRVVQVLSNIIGNALKFTPQNGKICIYANSYETPQSYEGSHLGLELKIVDNGPGIPKDKLNSVFNKFEQARANDRKIGTGLGLTIVKNICELHNGGVTVESDEGHGSTFIIRLPRLIDNSKDEEISEDKSKLIFIANDDELYRKRLKKLFNSSIYKVAEGTNGVELLQYLDTHTPDLIILDHEMPVLDGLKAWKEYCETHNASIPVILLSNNVEGESAAWMRDHISDILPVESSPSEIENRAISILFPAQLTSLDKKLDPYKKTVLIVDDEEAIRSLLHEIVIDNGYNSIMAKNGVEALFLVQKYRIDLVVSDIRMSEGDGILLTKAIKKEFPLLPIALMSANIDGISENVAKKLNVECLITKPFDIDQFSRYITDIIGRPALSAWTDIFREGSLNDGHVQHATIPLLGDMEEPQMTSVNKDISVEKIEKITSSNSSEVTPNVTENILKIENGNKSGPRILLVDDSSDMQILFKLLLRKEDITLDVVSDGKKAFEKVSALGVGEYYDTIFMDLNMPEMNGDEATTLIRQWEEENNKIPQRIVLLSASSQEEGLALMDKGFDSFIQKPINKEKILGEVKTKKAS